ncbi:hypothetical protein HD554DRAFT_2094692 [Boletus coccyginus]|nr:hypothetical protein HD554DRAFT_2094692 [Boletus coccyginus]
MRSPLPDILPIYALTALTWASSAAAAYLVDDANPSKNITYAASGTKWQYFSSSSRNLTLVLSDRNVTVDSSTCWERNYHLAACTASNNCSITFPFTGSGISVYVMHAGFQGINASLAIDGGQSVTATTLPPPTPPSYQTPNVSLFDLQSLPNTDHTATINLLDWEGGTTSFYFDYAYINEVDALQPSTTQPAAAFSTFPTVGSTFIGSSSTSGATSTASNTESSVNLSAVVGGACGGLAALIAIVTAIIFLKKRRSRHAKLAESRKPDPFPATPAVAHDQIVPSAALPPADSEKTRMRLAARNAVVYQARRLSDNESSDFHILPTAGNAGRAPDGKAGPSTINPFLHDDFVIDCRREGGSLRSHGSVVQDTFPPTIPDSSAPPDYETLESRGL